MTILALDTSLASCSVALWRDGVILARRFEAMARGHAEALVPMIEATRLEAGVAYEDVSLVAVTVGPGTFTGIRVGLAAARGLALALGIPAVGLTTLEVLAAAVEDEARADEAILVAIDARDALYYAQAFLAGPAPLCPPALAALEQVLAMPGSRPALLTGGGAERAVAAAAAGMAPRLVAGPDLPDAATVARLAAARPRPAPGEPPKPLYLRPPNVRPPERAARP